MKKFILQAITEENHLTAVRQLLSIPDPQQIIFSIAFMTEGGLSILEDALKPIADRTTIFAGIRNGITSAQALQMAIDIGCRTVAVDTGSRTRIFHPKIYFSKNADIAHLITGSANLTIGGLNSNIEASIWQELDLADEENTALVKDVATKLLGMMDEYPAHVFDIGSTEQIDSLLEAGRVSDESVAPPPEPAGSSRNRDKDSIPNMPLKTKQIRRPRPTRRVPAGAAAEAPPPIPAPRVSSPARERLELVWESSPLTRRDLTIPTSASTHQTGSMLFKKGNSDIDQQKYFKAHIFNNLNWQSDPKIAGKELAEANFQIVIRDVDYGVHRLIVTNDMRTNTKSYEQKQPMSAIRWGAARSLISKEDLLDRTMLLYRDNSDTESFVIEID